MRGNEEEWAGTMWKGGRLGEVDLYSNRTEV